MSIGFESIEHPECHVCGGKIAADQVVRITDKATGETSIVARCEYCDVVWKATFLAVQLLTTIEGLKGAARTAALALIAGKSGGVVRAGAGNRANARRVLAMAAGPYQRT